MLCAAICVCVARCCLATFIILKHVYTPVNTFEIFSFSSFSLRTSFFVLPSSIAPKPLRRLHSSSLVSSAPAARSLKEIRVGKFRVFLHQFFSANALLLFLSKKSRPDLSAREIRSALLFASLFFRACLGCQSPCSLPLLKLLAVDIRFGIVLRQRQ